MWCSISKFTTSTMAVSTRLSVIIAFSAAVVLIISVYAFSEINAARKSMADHNVERSRILNEEALLALGGTVELSSAETLANQVLMDAKRRETDEGFLNVSNFNPSQHFFKRKRFIEESDVFKIIKKMPKAAVLHAHDTALIGGEFLVKNITYMDNLYICIKDGNILLQFFRVPPAGEGCTWQLLSALRQTSQDIEEFDNQLGKYFTMLVDDPENAYPDLDVAWSKFANIFITITPMLTYKPVWELFLYEALRQFRDDGVFYMEIRTTLPDLYDLDGNVYNAIECARSYKEVNDQFKSDYPDSFGFRFIYAPMRLVSTEEVRFYVQTAVQLQREFGDFFAGFDLVGQEDKGKPLIDFIDELIALPESINVYYHSGETNWYGSSSDKNLIDAILLGAKRLGHGYALLKHPVVAKMVLENDVAIEINPISNQVLKLVEDMRNHPAAVMLANNYGVVISSDDPGLWGGLPMSHDLYEAFIGFASMDSDIRMLKQLALNTIKYSAMPQLERVEALVRYTDLWNRFVNELVHNGIGN